MAEAPADAPAEAPVAMARALVGGAGAVGANDGRRRYTGSGYYTGSGKDRRWVGASEARR